MIAHFVSILQSKYMDILKIYLNNQPIREKTTLTGFCNSFDNMRILSGFFNLQLAPAAEGTI